MILEPLNDQVIVVRDQVKDKSSGGIILPDQAKELLKTGTILSAGPGSMKDGVFVKASVKKGDRVLFGSYVGSDIDFAGTKLLIMKESEIFAVIRE